MMTLILLGLIIRISLFKCSVQCNIISEWFILTLVCYVGTKSGQANTNLGQVGNDFTPFHSCIVVFVNQQRFNNHKDLKRDHLINEIALYIYLTICTRIKKYITLWRMCVWLDQTSVKPNKLWAKLKIVDNYTSSLNNIWDFFLLTSSLPCEQMAGQDRQVCTKFGQWLLPASDAPTKESIEHYHQINTKV